MWTQAVSAFHIDEDTAEQVRAPKAGQTELAE
jgi:hypothetical protein